MILYRSHRRPSPSATASTVPAPRPRLALHYLLALLLHRLKLRRVLVDQPVVAGAVNTDDATRITFAADDGASLSPESHVVVRDGYWRSFDHGCCPSAGRPVG